MKSADEIQSAKNLATVIYALQAAGFAIGISYLVAPVIIYLKRASVTGTWVESHLRWQLNTFWYSLAGVALGLFTLQSMAGFMILAATVLWVVFRIVQGWSRLSRGQSMLTART
ncbi:MAG: hypothetical protein PHE55_03000 [Methylococcaceae bacterium]|nr:hypothetical protein [Methylococcaceae bacterium]